MPQTFLSDTPEAPFTGVLDPRPSLVSLERRAEPFRQTIVRLLPEERYGLVRWSRRQERGVDFLIVQYRPLDGGTTAMPFARPAEFAPETGTVRAVVSTTAGTLTLDAADDTPIGHYLLAQAVAWAKAHYPDYTRSAPDGTVHGGQRVADLFGAWNRDAVVEVAADTLVADLRAAQARAAALEERLPVLCDERNLLRERIVHLTAGCVALGATALVLLAYPQAAGATRAALLALFGV